MEAVEALMSRQSVSPRELVEPAPSDRELEEIFEIAVRAPDHGAVRPWRFVIIRGENLAALGEVFVEALKTRDPNADQEAIEKERNRPLRSPLIIAICAEVKTNHPKVPVVEQLLSCAAATQNILMALHVKGFGGILLTGENAYDPHVKTALGLEEKDAIIGFLYAGTPRQTPAPKPRPDPMRFVRSWYPPAGG